MIVAGSTTPEQFQPGERVPAVSLPDGNGSRAMVDVIDWTGGELVEE